MQAQLVLNRISEIIDSPPPGNVNNQQTTSTLPKKLDNVSEDKDEDNNVSILVSCFFLCIKFFIPTVLFLLTFVSL